MSFNSKIIKTTIELNYGSNKFVKDPSRPHFGCPDTEMAQKTKEKLDVFKTLMAMCGNVFSYHHVEVLNRSGVFAQP